MIFISDEAEKFEDIQHFCLMEKNIGYFTSYGGQYINLVKKLMFDKKAMYNRVIGNLNSEQLVFGPE